MSKFYLYLVFNLKRLERHRKDNNLDKFNKISYKASDLYVDAIFKSSKCSFEVLGIENIDLNETYFVVSNHLGMVDIAAIMKAFPKYVSFVSKKELSKIPVFSRWMRNLGSVFMDRESVRDSIKELNLGVENLKKGINLCIFPEGTRSLTKEIGEFKKGSFKMAIKANVKILPTVLVGTRSVYEENGNRVCAGDVKVIFLNPIDINELSSDDVKNLHKIVRNKIEDTYKNFV